MFPLGECTAYFQSAVEAEIDVCSLVVAMRSSPAAIRHIVMKYVVVAELTFLDALESVFATGKGEFWRRAPKTTTLGRDARDYRKDFEVLKSAICPGLHETVRNRGAAHKKRLFVETEGEMMRTLNSREPGRLFQMGRGVLDHLATKPVWKWGYSSGPNTVTALLGTCSRPAPKQSSVDPIDGFGVRGFHGLHPESVVEELEFASVAAANAWANSLDFASLCDEMHPNSVLNPTGVRPTG